MFKRNPARKILKSLFTSGKCNLAFNQESITKEDLACSNFCLLKFVLYFDGLYGKLNLLIINRVIFLFRIPD